MHVQVRHQGTEKVKRLPIIVIIFLLISSAGCGKETSYTIYSRIADEETVSVKCFSGGKVIYDGVSQGRVISNLDGASYTYLVDRVSSKIVAVRGDCVITYGVDWRQHLREQLGDR